MRNLNLTNNKPPTPCDFPIETFWQRFSQKRSKNASKISHAKATCPPSVIVTQDQRDSRGGSGGKPKPKQPARTPKQ